jgi:hypothetical protein
MSTKQFIFLSFSDISGRKSCTKEKQKTKIKAPAISYFLLNANFVTTGKGKRGRDQEIYNRLLMKLIEN